MVAQAIRRVTLNTTNILGERASQTHTLDVPFEGHNASVRVPPLNTTSAFVSIGMLANWRG